MYATRRYAQAQTETASPERLMVLLFERALQHIRAGAHALESGRGQRASEELSKAVDIVAHLDATFDRARFPALAEKLGPVYLFTCQHLVSANAGRDARRAREAERVFAPVAEAFAAAVQQSAAGGAR